MLDSSIQRLSIIVPCLNEEGNVQRFQVELFDFFSRFNFEKEYIFIDDGSTDKTLVGLQNLAQKHPGIVILQNHTPKGLGTVIRSALVVATGDAILTLDADLTFHPSEFPKLLDAYATADCVTGSAFIGQFKGVSVLRRILSMSVNRIYARMMGGEITSASSMFRLYRGSSMKGIEFESENFDINAEIVAKLMFAGAKIVEVPVVLTQRIFGVSKINFVREIRNHLRLFFKVLAWKVHFQKNAGGHPS